MGQTQDVQLRYAYLVNRISYPTSENLSASTAGPDYVAPQIGIDYDIYQQGSTVSLPINADAMSGKLIGMFQDIVDVTSPTAYTSAAELKTATFNSGYQPTVTQVGYS